MMSRRLEHPVSSIEDVAGLDEEDRAELARWLSETDPARRRAPIGRRRRLLILAIASGAAVFLLPWIGVLIATLPNHHQTHEWRVAWVGFDVALVLGFSATAYLGWRGRQMVVTALIVTATLLFCDSWFDLTLSWGTPEQAASIVTAVLGELPFGIFLVASHHRLLRVLTDRIWHDRGARGEPPPLWRQRLAFLPDRARHTGP